jgi:RNA polymerase primary sigma factor
MKMITDSVLLSHAEQRGLTDLLPNKEARDKLVSTNLRFVMRVAKGFNSIDLHIDDKFMAGVEGLIIGIDKYDKNAENTLLSYAVHWIRQCIMREAYLSFMIHIPTTIQALIPKMSNLSPLLSDDEKSRELDITPKMLDHVRKSAQLNHWKHMDNALAGMSFEREELPIPYNEKVRSDRYWDTLDRLVQEGEEGVVNEQLSRLTDKHQKVMKMRYWGNATHEEIGLEMGYSKQRAQQVCAEAHKTLKVRLKHLAV